MSYCNSIEKILYKLSLGAMDYGHYKGHYSIAFEKKLILGNYNKKNL